VRRKNLDVRGEMLQDSKSFIEESSMSDVQNMTGHAKKVDASLPSNAAAETKGGFLAKLRLSHRIYLGFGLLLALILIITTYASINQLNIRDAFGRTNELLGDERIVASLETALLEADLAVKNYISENDPSWLETFEKHQADINQNLIQANENIKKPARAEKLDIVDEAFPRYKTAFDNIVSLQQQRNELVQNKLNVLGPDMHQDLTSIMESAYRDQNVAAP